MLHVTGADWFCMCDRAGPKTPAMGGREEYGAEAQNS